MFSDDENAPSAPPSSHSLGSGESTALVPRALDSASPSLVALAPAPSRSGTKRSLVPHAPLHTGPDGFVNVTPSVILRDEHAEAGPFITVRISSSAFLSLDELISDSRRHPLTQAEFRRFLQSKHAEEGLDFLLAVREYSALPNGSTEQAVAANRILHTFIQDHSIQQINISGPVRVQTIAACGDPALRATAFNAAASEIRRLIHSTNCITEFFAQSIRNITPEEIFRRRVACLVCVLLSLGVFLATFLGSDIRWLRLILLVPLFFCVALASSSYFGICHRLAMQQPSCMLSVLVWLQLSGAHPSCTVKVEEPSVYTRIHSTLQLQRYLIIATTLLLTGAAVALPSPF